MDPKVFGPIFFDKNNNNKNITTLMGFDTIEINLVVVTVVEFVVVDIVAVVNVVVVNVVRALLVVNDHIISSYG